MLRTAHGRQVYPATDAGVNRRGRRATWGMLLSAVLAATGCAAPAPVRPVACWIAVRYDVEPVFMRDRGGSAADSVVRELSALQALGFNAVVFGHLDDEDRAAAVSAAETLGMKAAVLDRTLNRFVRNGRLPVGCSNASDLAARVSRSRSSADGILWAVQSDGHDERLQRAAALCPAPAGRRVRPAPAARDTLRRSGSDPAVEPSADLDADPAPAHRPAEPGSASRHHDAPTASSWVIIGDSTGDEALRLVCVDTRTPTGEGASPLESWLGQLHRAWLGGGNAGVVVDRHRRPPGGPPGLAGEEARIPPAHAAAVRELVARAQCWGPQLRDAEPLTVAGIDRGTLPVEVAALHTATRRFLLVVNTAPAAYARGALGLWGPVAGADVRRAVEVPPPGSRVAGRVFPATAGRIELPVELRPGDAILLELF